VTSSIRLGFIGGGNMAEAIFSGMIKQGFAPQSIIVSVRSEQTRARLEEDYGLVAVCDNARVVRDAPMVMLAVKPYQRQEMLQPLQAALTECRPLLVSVAAGLSVEQLQRFAGGPLPTVRCMPNTPSLVGYGMSGLYASAEVSAAQRQAATQAMESVGAVQWCAAEHEIDIVIALAGSAPAYYFAMMEHLEAVGVKLGLPAERSAELVRKTAMGAAQLVNQTGTAPGELRRKVTSPNGTTAAALQVLTDHDFAGVLGKVADAAIARAQELTHELDKN
jgi:pyrroline-5-carboxylate reductase